MTMIHEGITGRSFALLCWGVLSLGCGSGHLKLDAKKVRSLSVRLADRSDTYCPNTGLLPEVVGVAVYDDGRVFDTWTPANGSGKLYARELEWAAEVGTVDGENGQWLLPVDLFPWHDRTLTVAARVPKRPEMNAQLTITPRYDCGGIADVKGLAGYDASPGTDADRGGDGPRVAVALAYVDTKLNGRLVLVRVVDRDYGRLGYYLVDPRARRPLTIAVGGGAGGKGGYGANGSNGSSGSRGADGATGGVCENGQDGGQGGAGQDGTDGKPGGRGGDGGNGGVITLSYPAAFPELASAVVFGVQGGPGGAGGQGGQAGTGGQGGQGGSGGSGGGSTPEQACNEYPTTGNAGPEGPRGRDGQPGANGAPGREGGSGVITSRTARIDELFAFELARGWAIVRD